MTEKQVKIVLALMAGLGGVAAILMYIDNQKFNALRLENAKLDKQIKELDLALKKHMHSNLT